MPAATYETAKPLLCKSVHFVKRCEFLQRQGRQKPACSREGREKELSPPFLSPLIPTETKEGYTCTSYIPLS